VKDKERLEEELAAAQQELAQIEERLETKGDYGLGEGDPLIVGWELALAQKLETETKIQEIEDALERMAEGTYGRCQSCGRPISEERLAVLPQAALCIDCARRLEES
jgi:RNA polymerase-binding transcription factor DksA